MHFLNRVPTTVLQNRPFTQRLAAVNEIQKFGITQSTTLLAQKSKKEKQEEKLNIISTLPEKPKKPHSTYIRFLATVRPKLIQQQPDTPITEIIKQAAAKWKTADKDTIARLQTEYLNDLEVYKKQIEGYTPKLTNPQKTVLDELARDSKRRKVRLQLKKTGINTVSRDLHGHVENMEKQMENMKKQMQMQMENMEKHLTQLNDALKEIGRLEQQLEYERQNRDQLEIPLTVRCYMGKIEDLYDDGKLKIPNISDNIIKNLKPWQQRLYKRQQKWLFFLDKYHDSSNSYIQFLANELEKEFKKANNINEIIEDLKTKYAAFKECFCYAIASVYQQVSDIVAYGLGSRLRLRRVSVLYKFDKTNDYFMRIFYNAVVGRVGDKMEYEDEDEN